MSLRPSTVYYFGCSCGHRRAYETSHERDAAIAQHTGMCWGSPSTWTQDSWSW